MGTCWSAGLVVDEVGSCPPSPRRRRRWYRLDKFDLGGIFFMKELALSSVLVSYDQQVRRVYAHGAVSNAAGVHWQAGACVDVITQGTGTAATNTPTTMECSSLEL